MPTPRLSAEPGHRRRFLVIVDETPECGRALRFAARRAEHTDGEVLLLALIEPPDPQSWRGVEAMIRAEAIDEATRALEAAVDAVQAIAPHVHPRWVIREGAQAPEIIALIEEDRDIAVLVLAAGTAREGPGPLVSTLAGRGAAASRSRSRSFPAISPTPKSTR